MSNCELDVDEEFDIRSLSSMKMKKLITSMEYISVNENKVIMICILLFVGWCSGYDSHFPCRTSGFKSC